MSIARNGRTAMRNALYILMFSALLVSSVNSEMLARVKIDDKWGYVDSRLDDAGDCFPFELSGVHRLIHRPHLDPLV